MDFKKCDSIFACAACNPVQGVQERSDWQPKAVKSHVPFFLPHRRFATEVHNDFLLEISGN